MADNYIGNRMDDYRAGKLSAPRRPKLTPSGRRPGSLELACAPAAGVWVGEGALLPAGVALIARLRNAGLSVCYRAESGKSGAAPAIRFGARHFPPEVAAPEASAEVAVSPSRIEIDAGRAIIEYAAERAAEAADMAAALLSDSGRKVASATLTLT